MAPLFKLNPTVKTSLCKQSQLGSFLFRRGISNTTEHICRYFGSQFSVLVTLMCVAAQCVAVECVAECCNVAACCRVLQCVAIVLIIALS